MYSIKKQPLFIFCTIFIILFSFTSCSSAQKLSKKELESRISKLEEENKKLKTELEVIQAQVRLLHNYLPKPGQDTRPNVGNGHLLEQVDSQVPANATAITFEETSHDFGSIGNDVAVSHTFKFKNTGTLPLIISNAKGSCGCTVPKWSREPIAAGEFGEVEVTFNSKGKKGNQHKSITITANTNPADTRLYIKASIQD